MMYEAVKVLAQFINPSASGIGTFFYCILCDIRLQIPLTSFNNRNFSGSNGEWNILPGKKSLLLVRVRANKNL